MSQASMTDSTPVLIAAIESEPILYDRYRSDFKDISKKRDVWRSVASKVGLTGERAGGGTELNHPQLVHVVNFAFLRHIYMQQFYFTIEA